LAFNRPMRTRAAKNPIKTMVSARYLPGSMVNQAMAASNASTARAM